MMFNFLVILSLTSALCVTINNYIFPLYQPDLVILVAYQEKGFFRKSIAISVSGYAWLLSQCFNFAHYITITYM